MTVTHFPYPEADYAVRIAQEPTTDGGTVFSASYVELPGCESQGDTEAEARENLKDAFALYVGDLLESGLEVPAPQRTQVHEIVSYSFTSPARAVAASSASPHRVMEVPTSVQARDADGSTLPLATSSRP
jgi:predicted RNase H-like HicB family nuclease